MPKQYNQSDDATCASEHDRDSRMATARLVTSTPIKHAEQHKESSHNRPTLIWSGLDWPGLRPLAIYTRKPSVNEW
jgi:hypothetical protein